MLQNLDVSKIMRQAEMAVKTVVPLDFNENMAGFAGLGCKW